MPGVQTTTAVLAGPASQLDNEFASYFVAGITERGPVGVPVLLRSMGDYQVAFGDRVPYGTLFDDLRTYFAEGGIRAWVVRVVGPNAPTTGSVALPDSATTGSTTSLTLNATSPGSWSTRVSVQVIAGSTSALFGIQVYYDNALVRTYANLSNPQAAVLALSADPMVRAVDAGNTKAAPTNNPAVQATPVLLSAGTDDRADITPTILLAAYSAFDASYGTGAVACPTYPSSVTAAPLLAHAQNFHRVALLAVAPGSNASQAKAAAVAAMPPVPANGGLASGGEYGTLVYPSLIIPDAGGVTRVVGPEGFTAAKRAQACLSAGGPWQVPAGQTYGTALFAVNLDVPVTSTVGDDLNANNVTALRIISTSPGIGVVRLYGWRSLSLDTANWYSLKDRDVVNAVQIVTTRDLEQFVFNRVDGKGQLLSNMKSVILGRLETFAQLGAFYPFLAPDGVTVLDPGYTADTGPSVNTAALLAANTIAIVTGVRPAPYAELVLEKLNKAAVNASF